MGILECHGRPRLLQGDRERPKRRPFLWSMTCPLADITLPAISLPLYYLLLSRMEMRLRSNHLLPPPAPPSPLPPLTSHIDVAVEACLANSRELISSSSSSGSSSSNSSSSSSSNSSSSSKQQAALELYGCNYGCGCSSSSNSSSNSSVDSSYGKLARKSSYY
ncbi:putative protein TPRXL isoform X1 [Vespa velutina]|uniref:putative protein TPRXL isoform X1 n=1 Tax=Vespa velutina TaxID=202808 RepID=UPI001FB56551|nr:putative protein TPRXL isoform X1 [Vespa velutina]